ncbi:Putative uncharacterized protein (fragment) [Avibacterium paragallinarum JF4211]|uniref:DUF551 domain-containing protein n=2 Tax=Avibacterium paragallinarum TaxID=728 RepID=A0A377IBX3_AVIPA
MKPFDLEKALAGEPVKLKNGYKAFIKLDLNSEAKNIDKSYIGLLDLFGYYTHENIIIPCRWYSDTLNASTDEAGLTIAGMWEDPKRYVNGIEVPEPVTLNTWENGRTYWYVRFTAPECVQDDPFYKYNERDERMISQGLVFKTKKGAEAMMKALLNYNVEYKNDDNAYANNGWIDINKQLPPLGTKVIGRCVIDGKVLILIIVKKLVGSEYWFSPVNIYGTFDDKAVDVTHWQPLPKLPQA